MAKLVRNKDGSIKLVHDEGLAEQENYNEKKQSFDNAKAIKKSKKEFKNLSQAEKDILIEQLLRIHDLI